MVILHDNDRPFIAVSVQQYLSQHSIAVGKPLHIIQSTNKQLIFFFQFFLKHKTAMKGRGFENISFIKSNIPRILRTNTYNEYRQCFYNLTKR